MSDDYVTLQDCMQLFTKEEELDGDERPVRVLSLILRILFAVTSCGNICILALHIKHVRKKEGREEEQTEGY